MTRNFDKYRNTRFIQKTDVENSPHGGALVTIKEVTEENVALDFQDEKVKYIIHFQENYKPWPPGLEVLEVIKQINGSGNVDDWPGTRLVLFIDPSVKFGGKVLGGIRCRAPKNQAPQQAEDVVVVQEESDRHTDNDIPF